MFDYIKCFFFNFEENYIGHFIMAAPDAKNWLIGKDPDLKDWRQEEKGMTEDEMAGWHHQFDGHEFEQALGVRDGQGGLVHCSPWCRKESDTTEWPNWTFDFKFFSWLYLFPLTLRLVLSETHCICRYYFYFFLSSGWLYQPSIISISDLRFSVGF